MEITDAKVETFTWAMITDLHEEVSAVSMKGSKLTKVNMKKMPEMSGIIHIPFAVFWNSTHNIVMLLYNNSKI